MNNDELGERIGKLADKVDNYLAATRIPIPAKVHLEQLQIGLREVSDELKAIHEDMTGRKLWSQLK